MRHIVRPVAVAIMLTLSFLPPTLLASDARAGRVLIRHNLGYVDRESDTGALLERKKLENGVTFAIRPVESLDVVVDDPNPLLYSYTWKLGERTNTADFEAAKKFAEAVNPVLDVLKGVAGQTAIPQGAAEVANICTVSGDPQVKALCASGISQTVINKIAIDYNNAVEFANTIPDLIKASAGSKEAAQKVKDDVLKDPRLARVASLKAALPTLNKAQRARVGAIGAANMSAVPVMQIASLGASLYFVPASDTALAAAELQTPPAGTAPLPPATNTGPTKPDTSAPSTSATKKKQASAKAKKEAAEKRAREDKAAAAAAESKATAAAALRLREQTFIADFSTLLDMRSDATAVIEAVDTFVAQVRKINVPLLLDTIPYNSKQNQPATLTINTVEVNKSAADPKVKTGDMAWTFGPKSPVRLHVDAAAVYSFIERHDFEAKSDGGQLKIARTDNGNEVNGATLGAMLTIVPQAWADPTFGGGFQIGITPEKDKLGFYTGAVVRLFDLVSLGAGLAYQQAERLGSGLVVGQPLTAADELKTDSVFKVGPYVTVTVKLK